MSWAQVQSFSGDSRFPGSFHNWHYISGRSMEICRATGVFPHVVVAVCEPKPLQTCPVLLCLRISTLLLIQMTSIGVTLTSPDLPQTQLLATCLDIYFVNFLNWNILNIWSQQYSVCFVFEKVPLITSKVHHSVILKILWSLSLMKKRSRPRVHCIYMYLNAEHWTEEQI